MISGDFGKLAELGRKMYSLATPALRAQLAVQLGMTAKKLVADEFRSETDPYGHPWEPLAGPRGLSSRVGRLRTAAAILRDRKRKTRRRKDKILSDTGRLRASFQAFNIQPTPTGFRFGSNVLYARFHQLGTSALPQRAMLPTRAGGLGPIWGAAFNATADAFLRRYLGAK